MHWDTALESMAVFILADSTSFHGFYSILNIRQKCLTGERCFGNPLTGDVGGSLRKGRNCVGMKECTPGTACYYGVHLP